MEQGAAQDPLTAVTQLPSVGVSGSQRPESPVKGNSLVALPVPTTQNSPKNHCTGAHPHLSSTLSCGQRNPPRTGCVLLSLPPGAAQDPQGQVSSSPQGFALSHINGT